jgi:hypothetical protein
MMLKLNRAISALLLSVLACGSPGASTALPSSTVTASPVATTATASPVPSAAPGAITGRIGYPSDFAPPVTVYAISTSDSSVYFWTDTPRIGNPLSATLPPGPTWGPTGPGNYTITGVTPGTYYVIAYRNDTTDPPQLKDAPGAYTQSTAKCDAYNLPTPLPGPCPIDHSLLPVAVTAGQTTTRIDIIDWFFHGGTYPSRPASAVGFTLPSGCSYAGSPVVGTGGSQWKFDCGGALNNNARGALAPAFVAQSWIGCGVGLGSGWWMKGDLRLIVTEGSGGPAPAGLPTLTQPARGVQTGCG